MAAYKLNLLQRYFASKLHINLHKERYVRNELQFAEFL